MWSASFNTPAVFLLSKWSDNSEDSYFKLSWVLHLSANSVQNDRFCWRRIWRTKAMSLSLCGLCMELSFTVIVMYVGNCQSDLSSTSTKTKITHFWLERQKIPTKVSISSTHYKHIRQSKYVSFWNLWNRETYQTIIHALTPTGM